MNHSERLSKNKKMNHFIKNLQYTLGFSAPYLKEDWPKIMYLIAPSVREIMPYEKAELQGFQLYRSSSVIQLHFSQSCRQENKQ